MEDLGLTMPDAHFWADKRVLLTGHTGFKGAWLSLWLSMMGAKVAGYARAPHPGPSLYRMLGPGSCAQECIGELRDVDRLAAFVSDTRPQIAIHMAAQAFVRRAYREPAETFETNVQGTVNLLEALRGSPDVGVVLIVTTDKVYKNEGHGRPFREADALGGSEPYSASKVGQELAARAYAASYFDQAGVAVACVRGGNVIGGGDFGEDRLVPDIVRATRDGRVVEIRHPDATRPWQHVLDCLSGYLTYVEALAGDPGLPRCLNIGPAETASLTVAHVADAVCRALGTPDGWRSVLSDGPHEAKALALDTGLAREVLGWRDRQGAEEALWATAEWYRQQWTGADMRIVSRDAILRYTASEHRTGPSACA